MMDEIQPQDSLPEGGIQERLTYLEEANRWTLEALGW